MKANHLNAAYHLLATLMFGIPLFGIFAPTALYVFRRHKDAEEERHARIVFNFQLSIALYDVLIFLFLPRSVGLVLGLLVSVFALTMMIYNAVLAYKGQHVGYPLALPLLKSAGHATC